MKLVTKVYTGRKKLELIIGNKGERKVCYFIVYYENCEYKNNDCLLRKV